MSEGGDHPDYPCAQLCSRCQVLQFDDSQFDDDEFGWRKRDVQIEPELIHVNRGCTKKVALKYKHTDVLPELEGLRRSAEETGCDFCRLLRQGILTQAEWKGRRTGRIDVGLTLYWRCVYAPGYGLNAIVADLSMPIDESERGNFFDDVVLPDAKGNLWQFANEVIFKAEAGSGNCHNRLQLEFAPNKEVLCQENIKAVQSLIDECSEHCGHNQLGIPRSLPTRLLDLEGPDDRICLVETHSLQAEQTKYAALSYCWGSKEDAERQTITTTDNVSSRLADISFDSLSQVMRDAIVATRRLSIRYLWIDCMCIIQDSLPDWERESAMMGAVYANAYVTLGALASSSCHQGFLNRPEPLSIPFRSTKKPSIKGTYNLRCYSQVDCPVLFDARNFDRLFNVWSSRAWTLQESKLSTRILHFGYSRLILTCANRESVEPFSRFLNDFTPERVIKDFPASYQGRVADPYQLWKIYSVWTQVTADITDRHLTNKHDLFPALSGIAKLVSSATGDTYVAGLWRDILPRGLDWECSFPDKKSMEERISAFKDPDEYIYPSWSWVAARTSVAPQKDRSTWNNYRVECEILSAWSDFHSELNPFGRIRYAEIQMKAPIIKLPSNLFLDTSNERRMQIWRVRLLGESHTANCYLDWKNCSNVIYVQGKLLMLPLISWKDDRTDSDSSGESETESYQGEDCEGRSRRNVRGLLLHSAPAEGKYIRVGVFESASAQRGWDLFKDREWKEIHLV